jgi:hypothetical protein
MAELNKLSVGKVLHKLRRDDAPKIQAHATRRES